MVTLGISILLAILVQIPGGFFLFQHSIVIFDCIVSSYLISERSGILPVCQLCIFAFRILVVNPQFLFFYNIFCLDFGGWSSHRKFWTLFSKASTVSAF